MEREGFFRSNLPAVEDIVAQVCRRHRLSVEETHDFFAAVRRRFVAQPHEPGHLPDVTSEFRCYLTAIIQSTFYDYDRTARRGSRASGEAPEHAAEDCTVEATAREMAACPSLQSIAAYIDGSDEHARREQIVRHLASCERCYFVFTETALMRTAVSMDGPGSGSRRRPAFMWAAAALAAALAVPIVAATLGWMRWRSPQSPELQALVKAVGADRPFEPRLAGGFAYGPVRPFARTAGAITSPVDLRLAAARIEKALVDHRTAENLHALGVAYLVTGDVDRSIATLQEASREAANEPSTMNDLAAAYLVRGLNGERREDIAKAASQAEKATTLSPSFAEALFNRALAFEALALRGDARKTWEKYLQLDSRSPWADEARHRLGALSEVPGLGWESAFAAMRDVRRCRDDAVANAAVAVSPSRAHDYFDDELLPSWADAYVAGNREEAAARLGCARTIADVFARDGDLMALDAVNMIRASSPHSNGAAMLARAHRTFRDARRLFEDSRFGGAESLFNDASAQFGKSRSSFEFEAAYFAARSAYRRQRLDAALATLTRSIDVATPRGYLYLAARAHRLRGVIEEGRSQLAAALEDYRTATTQYERIHDSENAAGVHNLLAEHLQTLGEPRESWDQLFRALSLLKLVSSPLQRYQILWLAIRKCMHDDLPDVALHFQDAFLDNARTWPNGAAVGATTDAHIERARVLRRLGDLKTAEQEVLEARRTVKQVRDSDLADRWNTEILVTEGENLQVSKPSDAIIALTTAIDQLQRIGSTLKLTYLFLLRGRARLATGDVDDAQSDFQRGIDTFEAQHNTIDSRQYRVSHFDESWDVFGDMIRLQLQRRKRPDLALEYVERGRARTLLESVTHRTDTDISAYDIAALQRRIPENIAVLSLATLGDELAEWIITKHSTNVVEQSIALSVLEAKTAALKDALTARNEHQQNAALSDLYDILIRPVNSQIPSDTTTLVMVPDGPLNSVPFAALLDRRTGRYLLEDRAIGVAPSIAIFAEMSNRLRAKLAERVPKLLVVGDPSINRSAYPNLPSLEGARAEALEIAGMYRGTTLLTEQKATKEQFLRSIRQNEIVHFAGHAVGNSEFPWLSRLLFAPGSEAGSDTLFSQDLADERLDQLRLVVLAACSTGVGAGARGEGVLSLARAFIAAGAPTVIASLWDVSDPASQRLFSTFYKHFRAGVSPLAALREAQLTALRGGDAADRLPVNWAGFAAIGGF